MVHDKRKSDSWGKVINNVESSLDRKIASLDEDDIATFDSDDDEGTAIVRGDKDSADGQSFISRSVLIIAMSTILSLILLGLLLMLLRNN